MQRNKIVSRQAKPKLIVISSAILVMLAGIVFFNKNPELLQKGQKTDPKAVQTLNFALIGFIAYFLICVLIPLYRNGNELAIKFTKKYLQKAIAENPELTRFQPVLENQPAMKKIATMVSNELRDSEQKRIIELINEIEFDSTEEHIEKVHDAIAKIIAEHALVHPEFLEHVHGALVNADYMMYVKQKQQETKTLLNQPKTK